MKHKVQLQWVISCVMLVLFILPCASVLADGDVFVIDTCDLLTTQELISLNEKAIQIKDKTGHNAMFVAVNDLGEADGFDYAEELYDAFYQEEPGVILLRDHPNSMNYVDFVNGLEDYVTDEELDEALNAFLGGSGYYDAVNDYFTSVGSTFSRINHENPGLVTYLNGESSEIEIESETVSQSESDTTTANETTSSETTPTSDTKTEGYYLVDLAQVFDRNDTTEINQKLQNISEKEKCDVIVVIVDSLGDKTPTEYADDYYDYHGYGYGETHDGLLLLISTGERKYAISTTGFAITAFTDAGLEYIVDQMISDLGDDYFYSAVMTFANLSEQFIQQARTGSPYDNGNLPKKPLSPLVYVVEVLVGFGIAFGLAMYYRSKMYTVGEQYAAADYTKPGSLVILNQNDQFINRTVTSRVIEKESSGSSTHTSSSGTTHGGTSGDF